MIKKSMTNKIFKSKITNSKKKIINEINYRNFKSRYQLFVKIIDISVNKNIIKKNKGARLKINVLKNIKNYFFFNLFINKI